MKLAYKDLLEGIFSKSTPTFIFMNANTKAEAVKLGGENWAKQLPPNVTLGLDNLPDGEVKVEFSFKWDKS